MPSNLHSSGRGGAGNIVDASKTPPIHPEDLQTPTLKTTSMVTTGRGGTGNMAANLGADEKRRRQDVEPVVRRDSHGATHVGRGGTGNVVMMGGSGDDCAVADPASPPPMLRRTPSPAGQEPLRKSEEPGWAEKGMNLLFGKK
ncbi:hypothetical protein BT67DRAFT_397427 [Trichocladium antarcticum]|uniref:Uncharacterized protein n=1 Tax=Trichocladium antarcticum TaxID=1450529 RepID=A0AAN6UP66_9PEZI|nr:hypothetical protein BT67DRAFT_397427 [Trichocladium antarcticum]